jgi:hypothetical protein
MSRNRGRNCRRRDSLAWRSQVISDRFHRYRAVDTHVPLAAAANLVLVSTAQIVEAALVSDQAVERLATIEQKPESGTDSNE